MKIDITNLQDAVRISLPAVRRVARTALKDMLGCYSLVFVDDDQMREVNLKYLGRDYTTDVIAFQFEDAPLTKDDCAGEIIISTDVALTESESRGLDVQAELALYIVHGALHLADFDDATPEQAEQMHQKEKDILASLDYDVENLWKPIRSQQKSGR